MNCNLLISLSLFCALTRQLEAAISSQLEVNLTLEQDGMIGVDESEWV